MMLKVTKPVSYISCGSLNSQNCCPSCHEDDNMGYDMCELYDENLNTIGFVCCDTIKAIENGTLKLPDGVSL